mgnify:CR=1 FL=1
MADQQPDDPVVAPETATPVPDDAGLDTTPESQKRRRLPRRTAVAALALGGLVAGFGGGYLLGHQTDTTTDQVNLTGFDGGTHPAPPGGMPGQDGQGGTSGQSGEQPDFDGDGQPDDGSASDGSSDASAAT